MRAWRNRHVRQALGGATTLGGALITVLRRRNQPPEASASIPSPTADARAAASPPNEVIKLAYEEARAALKEQDATLSNIRNRATGLLAAAAVGTSFAAAVGLLNTDPARGTVLPIWAG